MNNIEAAILACDLQNLPSVVERRIREDGEEGFILKDGKLVGLNMGFDYSDFSREEIIERYHYIVRETNYKLTRTNWLPCEKDHLDLVREDFLLQTGFDPESYDVSVREAKADRYERYSNED